jgi:hypothetical protein
MPIWQTEPASKSGIGFAKSALQERRRETTFPTAFCLLLPDDSRAVGPNTSGAVDAVGAVDGPRRWRRGLANDGGAIRPGTSSSVDAIGAGDGVSRRRHRQCAKRRDAHHGHRQKQNLFHYGQPSSWHGNTALNFGASPISGHHGKTVPNRNAKHPDRIHPRSSRRRPSPMRSIRQPLRHRSRSARLKRYVGASLRRSWPATNRFRKANKNTSAA